MMNPSDLDVTTTGIHFSVRPNFRFGSQRTLAAPSCFISNQTLDELGASRLCRGRLPEEIFWQLENEITGVASRLVLAGVRGQPLVIRFGNFNLMDS